MSGSPKPVGFWVLSLLVGAALAVLVIVRLGGGDAPDVIDPLTPDGKPVAEKPSETPQPEVPDQPADPEVEPEEQPEQPEDPVEPENPAKARERAIARAQEAAREDRWEDAVRFYEEALALEESPELKAALKDAKKSLTRQQTRLDGEHKAKIDEEGKKLEVAGNLEKALKLYREAEKENKTYGFHFRRKAESLELELVGAQEEYDNKLKEAKKAFEAREFMRSAELAAQALTFRPDGEEAHTLLKKANEALQLGSMVLVPAGDALLGTPAESVALTSYLVDKHPVTNREYFLFVSQSGHRRPPTWPENLNAFNDESGDLPVTGVSYVDAAAYAAWAGKRLPTEQEWEKAARYVDGRRFPWGDLVPDKVNEIPALCMETKGNAMVTVGSYPDGASPYGVEDTIGGVWEWTTTESGIPGGEIGRILKGGSWMYSIEKLHLGMKLVEDPGLTLPDVGFRCVRDPGN